MAGVQFSYIVGLLLTEFHAHNERLEDRRRDIAQSPVKLGCKRPKAWQDCLGEPDVVVLFVPIAPNLVAFLVTQSYTRYID